MTAVAVPPGPSGRPVMGNLSDFSRDPLQFLTRCAQEHGDCVRMTFLGSTAYLLSHPDYIEHVLWSHHREFRKGISFRSPIMRGLLGDGLVSSEGEFWVRQRRLAQPSFHRERIQAYGEVMVEYTERMLARWKAGETRDIHPDFMRLALEIVAKTLFNVDIGSEAGAIGRALEALMEQFTTQWGVLGFLDHYIPTITSMRFRGAIRQLDEVVLEIIRRRRAEDRDTGDLLSMLLAAQDEDGSRMTDRQLRDEAMTFLFAGHETTALTLTWTCYLLTRHPEAEARLIQELEEVLDGRAAGATDLPRLSWAECVIRESMRLYSPVWSLGREAIQDCSIGGYHVPRGTQLILSQWVTHRDPRFWEEPEAFRPERWEDEREKDIPRTAYFPFGGGPRACIGLQFAMMEAVLVLATVYQRFRLTLAPGHRVTPWPTMTLRPREGVRLVLATR
jgi:cytochrome P450